MFRGHATTVSLRQGWVPRVRVVGWRRLLQPREQEDEAGAVAHHNLAVGLGRS